MKYPRLVIAGTHSGVGKTTVTLALLAGFRRLGRRVQPFKVGPDFIDPGHHQMASGRESRNLDGWMLGPLVNRVVFQEAAQDADLSIVEGMMGLFDGSSPTKETGSTAEMAKQLDSAVLLVIDGSAMAGSAAAMVFGYTFFDPEVTIAGVVFNRIKSKGHYELLKSAVERNAHVPVVGYLSPDPALTIPDRHLGLQTAMEGDLGEVYDKLGEAAQTTLDLEQIEALAFPRGDWEEAVLSVPTKAESVQPRPVRVGIGHDRAFCFYYPDNLRLLQEAGGECIRFSPIDDRTLPEVDLLYLGGGYPEVYASLLTDNPDMHESIRQFAGKGGVVYAECGGLMYLSKSLRDFDGKVYGMVGIFPVDVAMSRERMTIGYRELVLEQTGILGEAGMRVRGHEFHYSHLENTGETAFLGSLRNAQGKDCGMDGLVSKNAVGLYTHLHFASHPAVPVSLIQAGRQWREEGGVVH